MFKQYSAFISFLFLQTFLALAQSNITSIETFLHVTNTGGKSLSNTNYEVSFSIGEPLVNSYTDNNTYTINEGIIHPCFISPKLTSTNGNTAFCKGATINLISENTLFPLTWENLTNNTKIENQSTYTISNFNYEKTIIIAYGDFPLVQADTFIVYLEDIARCFVDLSVYELITPDGSGKNDFFFIENIDKLINNEVFLFNRWGDILFHQENYDNKYTPTELENGEYIYMIKDHDRNKTYTGNLIIRK